MRSCCVAITTAETMRGFDWMRCTTCLRKLTHDCNCVICSAYGFGAVSVLGVSTVSATVCAPVSAVGLATGLMAELIALSVRFMLTLVSCLTLWLTDVAAVGDKILDFGNDI